RCARRRKGPVHDRRLVREHEGYYVDADAARDALRRRAIFNVIDNATGWKVDFIVRKNRPFSREEFRRRQALTLLGVRVFVASAEDPIAAAETPPRRGLPKLGCLAPGQSKAFPPLNLPFPRRRRARSGSCGTNVNARSRLCQIPHGNADDPP